MRLSIRCGGSQEHRLAGNDPNAPLHQRERAGNHCLAAVPRTQGGLALHGIGAKIQSQRRLVTFHRIHQGKHHIRCGGDVAQGVASVHQTTRDVGKARLIDIRPTLDHRRQAIHQREIGVHHPFEPRSQRGKAVEYVPSFVFQFALLRVAYDELCGNEYQQHGQQGGQPDAYSCAERPQCGGRLHPRAAMRRYATDDLRAGLAERRIAAIVANG